MRKLFLLYLIISCLRISCLHNGYVLRNGNKYYYSESLEIIKNLELKLKITKLGGEFVCGDLIKLNLIIYNPSKNDLNFLLNNSFFTIIGEAPNGEKIYSPDPMFTGEMKKFNIRLEDIQIIGKQDSIECKLYFDTRKILDNYGTWSFSVFYRNPITQINKSKILSGKSYSNKVCAKVIDNSG